jgi:micrococcal nuclease
MFAFVLALTGCVDPGRTLQGRPLPPLNVEPGDGRLRSKSPVRLITATVTRVVDGDTIHVRVNGQKGTVRFIGLDTPEIAHPTYGAQPFSREACEYAKAQLYGRQVYLETDRTLRDRHGRLLAYVWLARPAALNDQEIRAKMFNARLLREGYAHLMTVPPNVKYVDFFRQYQSEARAHNRGLWELSDTESVYAGEILTGNYDPANFKKGCVSCKGCRR